MSLTMEKFFPIFRPDFFFFDNFRSRFESQFGRMEAEMDELLKQQFSLLRDSMFKLAPIEPLDKAIIEIKPTQPIVQEKGETKLKLNFNVHGFKPEEVEVKVIGDNVLQVIANSVQKTETSEHKRHYMSQYTLPKGIVTDNLKPVMSKDGVLTIEAPAMVEVKVSPAEKLIPIEMTK